MFLIDKMNKESIGPYFIQVVVCDDKFLLSEAMACFKRFAIDDPVQYVVGGHTTFTVAAGNYFEKYQILNIQYAKIALLYMMTY
jgi:ABC-type branched-subunit amino acid transport system substrate-binding protein